MTFDFNSPRSLQQPDFTEHPDLVGLTSLSDATAAVVTPPLDYSIRTKFLVSLAVALLWSAVSYSAADAWIVELSKLVGAVATNLIIFGIVVVPGMISMFLVSSLLMDRRPRRKPNIALPGVTILIAAYNEEDSILGTLESIASQHYPAALDVIAINDGSRDSTVAKLRSVIYPWLRVIDLKKNGGKANALNEGLKLARHGLTVTLDGDSYLHKDALKNLVGRLLSDPPNTAAVAGAVLVRNSRTNLVTRIQEWDYFHGIAAVKRVQSMYHGALVAQGAFSVYRTSVLREVGGWPESVGEDIVLTWAIHERGYRVGYAEDACLFTNAPDTLHQFIRQRERWSRGLIEAFKYHWPLLFRRRMSTVFVWYNLTLPYVDLVFALTFIPGIILALFGYFLLAGPMTLLVLPLAMLVNYLMYSVQSKMFVEQGLQMRGNLSGFILYALLYGAVLQPACVVGYFKELFNVRKTWGTK